EGLFPLAYAFSFRRVRRGVRLPRRIKLYAAALDALFPRRTMDDPITPNSGTDATPRSAGELARLARWVQGLLDADLLLSEAGGVWGGRSPPRGGWGRGGGGDGGAPPVAGGRGRGGGPPAHPAIRPGDRGVCAERSARGSARACGAGSRAPGFHGPVRLSDAR